MHRQVMVPGCAMILIFSTSGCGTEQRMVKEPLKPSAQVSEYFDYVSPEIIANGKKKAGKPWPSQESLNSLLRELRRVRIISCRNKVRGKEVFGKKTELEISSPEQIQELRECLLINESERVSFPFSPPLLILELYGENGFIAEINCLSTSLIQWSGWRCETRLADPLFLSKWLAEHGVTLLEDERTTDAKAWEQWKKDNPSQAKIVEKWKRVHPSKSH